LSERPVVDDARDGRSVRPRSADPLEPRPPSVRS